MAHHGSECKKQNIPHLGYIAKKQENGYKKKHKKKSPFTSMLKYSPF